MSDLGRVGFCDKSTRKRKRLHSSASCRRDGIDFCPFLRILTIEINTILTLSSQTLFALQRKSSCWKADRELINLDWFVDIKTIELRKLAKQMLNRFIAAALLSAFLITGCIKPANQTSSTGTPSATTGNNTTEAAGNTASKEEVLINSEGSSTVYLIAQAMAVEFEKATKHKVSVGRNGTGGGYKKFALRQCDLWNASRPIDNKEVEELKGKGIEWVELTVAIDGLSIAVHPENDWCKSLSVAQLKKLWEPDSKIMKWNELDPSWPDQPIKLFGADTDSGTFEYFTEVIVGKKKASRTDYQQASDDNVLIQGVSGSKYSLGYIPFGYCIENKDKVKTIAVSPTKDESETAAPAVAPTPETIISGEYSPLSRPLFVYANREAMKRPEVMEYLKFFVSETAQPLITQRGFICVTEETRKKMVDRLAEFKN